MNQQQFTQRYRYDKNKDRIGGGSFGTVYKVFDTVENQTYALKIAEVKHGMENLSLQNEVELNRTLPTHVNIARYLACYRFDLPAGDYDFGLMQYYPDGNLSQLIRSKTLTDAQKESIALGIIEGLGYLHDNKIVHRDLKSGNILVAKSYEGDYIPKLADFGLSKQFKQNEGSYFSNSLVGGTLSYAAPEQLKSNVPIKKNVDIWSLGVILYELWQGVVPFKADRDTQDESSRQEIIQKINNATLPKGIQSIPEPWQTLIRKCIVVDNSQRLQDIAAVKAILGMQGSKRKDEGTILDEPAQKPKKPKSTSTSKPKTSATTKGTPASASGSVQKWSYLIVGGIALVIAAIVGVRSCDGDAPATTELTIYESDGHYGYKDVLGNVVIPARYEIANPFSDGRAKVSVVDSVYYINTSGHIVEMIQPLPQPDAPKPDDGEKDEIGWKEANVTNTKSGYEKYLDDFPSGRHINAAKKKIRAIVETEQSEAERKKDESAWQQATRSNTKSAYELYIRDYPSGRYVIDARNKIRSIDQAEQSEADRKKDESAWQQATRSNTKSAYDLYVRNFPSGRYVIDARNKIKSIEENEKPKPDPSPAPSDKPYIKMISIPGRSYKLSETEVTIGQYLAFCKATNSHWPEWLEVGSKYHIQTGSDNYYSEIGMSESNVNHPITGVSALDADAFCRWMGGRLPTKQEWEYAAKGGEAYAYSGSNNIKDVGWTDYDSGGKPHRVKGKSPNGYGLYDMSGNVWEWTSSKQGSVSFKCGGSWRNLFVFITDHKSTNSNEKNSEIGFRLAR